MNPGNRAQIGKQGIEVTRMGLGGAGYANLFRATTDAEAVATVAAAYDAGIRYFDTAPLYGMGLSERRLGMGLAAYDRGDVVISSKVGRMLVPRDPTQSFKSIFTDVPDLESVFDFSRDAVHRSIEQSLLRLQTDRLDIVLVHDPDASATNVPGADPYSMSHFDEVMEQTYPALDELRRAGTIGAIGIGINQWQMLRDFAKAGDWDCFLMAGHYTLLEQEALEGLFPLCTEKGVRIILGGPYNSGILATGSVEGAKYNYMDAPEDLLDRVRQIEAVCGRHSVPLQAAALQFPLGHPVVAAVIPGARTADEVRANVGFLQADITNAFWEDLQSEGLLNSEAPIPSA